MKKTILVLVVIFAGLFSQAQVIEIQDSTVQMNQKLNLANAYLTRLQQEYEKLFDKEKVETGSVEYASETKALMEYFWKGYNKYAEQFVKVDTLEYEKKKVEPYTISTGQKLDFDYFRNGKGMIQEWDSLNVRINELQNDPEIKYLKAIEEFKKIKERQTKLRNRFDKLQKK